MVAERSVFAFIPHAQPASSVRRKSVYAAGLVGLPELCVSSCRDRRILVGEQQFWLTFLWLEANGVMPDACPAGCHISSGQRKDAACLAQSVPPPGMQREPFVHSSCHSSQRSLEICPSYQVVTASWEAHREGSPRDDGFRSGLSVLLTDTSELPAEWKNVRAGRDLSWWS